MILLAFLSEFHYHVEARSPGDGDASAPQGGTETPIVEFQGVGRDKSPMHCGKPESFSFDISETPNLRGKTHHKTACYNPKLIPLSNRKRPLF